MTQPVVISTTFTPTVVNVTAPVTGQIVQVTVSNAPGPQGLPGPQGVPGAAGAVQDLAAADGTITVGGTTAHPTVKATTGTTVGTVLAGNDPSVTNARRPTAHASSHGTAGSDPVSLDAAQVMTGRIPVEHLASPMGAPYTILPGLQAAVISLNNGFGYYMRITEGGTIDRIYVYWGSSLPSKVSVAVYRNSGAGRNAVPGTQAAVSGAVSAVAGVQGVTLGSTVTVNPGDWLAISVNATCTINGITSTAGVNSGFTMEQSSAHPLPAPAAPTTSAVRPMLVGSNGA